MSGGRTRKRCASACGGWIDCRDLPCVFDHEGPLPLVTHGAAGALAAKNATSRFGGEAFPTRATGPFGTGAYFGRLSDAGRMAAEQGRDFGLEYQPWRASASYCSLMRPDQQATISWHSTREMPVLRA